MGGWQAIYNPAKAREGVLHIYDELLVRLFRLQRLLT